MSNILGIDPGLSNTAVVAIRSTPGISPVLLNRLLICKDNSPPGDSLDTINRIWYDIKQFALLQEPDLIALESFSWQGQDEDRDGPRTRCPKCGHIYAVPESAISPDAQDMFRLMGALNTLSEIAPIVEFRPAVWRIELTGHPMPKKKRIDGRTVRTGYEHHVRKRVYEVLGLNGGEILSVHEVDAAGIALVAALGIGANSCTSRQGKYGLSMTNYHCQH